MPWLEGRLGDSGISLAAALVRAMMQDYGTYLETACCDKALLRYSSESSSVYV